jgi:Bacteriophage probable baseplate hub protein
MGLADQITQRTKSFPGISPEFTINVYIGDTFGRAIPLPNIKNNLWKQRIQSITLSQQSGDESDSLNLSLDNADGYLPGLGLPQRQYLIDLALGYDKNKKPMGRYKVTKRSMSGPPNTISITAESVPSNTNIYSVRSEMRMDAKAKKIAVLKDVLAEIATNNKLDGFVVSKSLELVAVTDPYQYKETDLNYLHRLAGEHGAFVKMFDGKIGFIERTSNKNSRGQELVPVLVKSEDIIHWNLDIGERFQYEAVKARWRDTDSAVLSTFMEESTNVNNGKEYVIPEVYSNKKRATEAAKSKLVEFEEKVSTITLDLVGNPYLSARGWIEVKGTKGAGLPKGLKGIWNIEQVTHSLSSSGYTCNLSAFGDYSPL